jgi:hypothetical protein
VGSFRIICLGAGVERYPAQSNPAISKLQPLRAIARVRHRLGFPLAFFGSLLASFDVEHSTGSTPLASFNPRHLRSAGQFASLRSVDKPRNHRERERRIIVGNPQATDTPPVIQINGDNPAIVQVEDTYNDRGATITSTAQ